MSAETMTDAQADALIEAVGERMGMHQGAWDMVNGRELARAFAAELRATPPAGKIVWVGRHPVYGHWALHGDPLKPDRDRIWWDGIQIGEAASEDEELTAIFGAIAPGACQLFRLVPVGAE